MLSFASGARRYRSSSLRLPALCTSIAVFAITDSLRLPSLCVVIAAISITGALRVHDWLLLLGDKPWNLIRLALQEFIRASLVDSFARRFVRSSIRRLFARRFVDCSLVDSFTRDSFARRLVVCQFVVCRSVLRVRLQDLHVSCLGGIKHHKHYRHVRSWCFGNQASWTWGTQLVQCNMKIQ